jgi:hypothetical protein
MLYSISTGSVQGYEGGQSAILHLVVPAEEVRAKGLAFVFTDGHAAMAFTEFFDDLEDLTQIDWAVMRSVYWNDTPQEPDRKRRRQAEFLVQGFVPWELVRVIGVKSEAVATKVREILDAYKGHRPEVSVKPSWYYD